MRIIPFACEQQQRVKRIDFQLSDKHVAFLQAGHRVVAGSVGTQRYPFDIPIAGRGNHDAFVRNHRGLINDDFLNLCLNLAAARIGIFLFDLAQFLDQNAL